MTDTTKALAAITEYERVNADDPFALRVAAADRALLERHNRSETLWEQCDHTDRGPLCDYDGFEWPCPDVADRLALWGSR